MNRAQLESEMWDGDELEDLWAGVGVVNHAQLDFGAWDGDN